MSRQRQRTSTKASASSRGAVRLLPPSVFALLALSCPCASAADAPDTSNAIPMQFRLTGAQRATSSASWLALEHFDFRVGVSTLIDPAQSMRLSGFPLPGNGPFGQAAMHLGGVGHVANWSFGLSADTLRTEHGATLDMDLRVDYRLRPNFALFGGYRLSENLGDPVEAPLAISAPSARLGLQVRF